MAKLKQIGIDVDINRKIEANRISFSESENDILRRILLKLPEAKVVPTKPTKRNATEEHRTRGDWVVSFFGTTHSAPNMKEAYKKLLLLFDEKYPDFLQKFAGRSSRSRLFISKRPEEIYGNAPHLAQDYAKPLARGWFYDSNLSKEQVDARLSVAGEVVNAAFGRDFGLGVR
jgi:hypothetical protein